MNYLLVVIDVFSKFLWVRPMKNKSVHSLVQALDSILSEKRKPEKLRIPNLNLILFIYLFINIIYLFNIIYYLL